MKRISIFAVAASLLAVCSCSNKMESPAGQIEPGGARLTAYTESRESRTSVVDGGTEVFWNTEDEIKVFSGESSGKFVSLNSELALSAEFAGPSGFSFKSGEDIAAVYPYSEDATWDGEAFTLTLPSEQVACPGTFAKGMNIAVAKSKDSHALQFRNVGGGVRFSVKEEGVKKIIFEGLDGEAIAGKVKIGFEDGIPVVREVTDGRLFITLTAPDGASFEVGKWYYIVAIPGALKKGYKLRFYKEDTYARLTSENAVQVKRSIFGSIACADEGLNYSGKIHSKPNTLEEFEKSFEVTREIGDAMTSINESLSNDGITDLQETAKRYATIPGVNKVFVNTEYQVISVMQDDSVSFNIFMDTVWKDTDWSDNMTAASSLGLSFSKPCVPQEPMSASILSSHYNTHDKLYLNNGGKALIMAPYYHDIHTDVDFIAEQLEPYFRNTPVILRDNSADVFKFTGDYLSQYDMIVLITHGGIGCRTISSDTNDKNRRWDWWLGFSDVGGDNYTTDEYLDDVFTFSTSWPYSPEDAQKLVDEYGLSWEDIGISYDPDTKRYYFLATPGFLKNASLEGSAVILLSCRSSEIWEGKGSMKEAFINAGAAIYSGYVQSVANERGSWITYKIVEFMAHGIPFKDAADFWKNNRFCEMSKDFMYDSYSWVPEQWFIEHEKKNKNEFLADFKSGMEAELKYSINAYVGDSPYLLFNPYPQIHEITETASSIKISWDCPLAPFDCKMRYPTALDQSSMKYTWQNEYVHQTVVYDVYVDDKKIDDEDNTDKKAILGLLNSGDHKCYVVAKVISSENNTVISTFKSDVKSFKIKNGSGEGATEAVDLGLSVKWASCNLGASKPEEYGGYYQWAGLQDVTDTSIYLDLNNCPYHTGSSSSTGWTKYIPSYYTWYWSGFGSPDDKTVLDPEDDVAHVTLGGKWRMPTEEEFNELRGNCTSEWITLNGVKGRKFTSKKNGNSIFLPAAGYRYSGRLGDVGSYGYYWSSSLNTDSPRYAYRMLFYSGDVNSYHYDSRYYGHPVRPVYDEGISGQAVISVSPEAIEFGTVSLGESATASFTITNTGTATASVSITNPSDVVTSDVSGDITIGVGASKTVTLTFTPKEKGSYGGRILVSCGGTDINVLYEGTCIEKNIDAPEAVDLGLPSGLKWASCNLGASKPEEYGGYYQWAGLQDVTDTSIYLDYSNCPYHTGSDQFTGWTKYIPSNNSSYWSGSGSPDNKTVLDPEDDVAHVKLGGKWRMPTEAEFEELIDNCYSRSTTLNGVSGLEFISYKNGNSIFLPAAGCRSYGNLDNVGSIGYYWSSSLNTDDLNYAFNMFFYSGYEFKYYDYFSRYYGQSVRPVSE